MLKDDSQKDYFPMFNATISLAIAELQQNDPIFTSSYLPLGSSLPYGRMNFEQHQKEQIIGGRKRVSFFSFHLSQNHKNGISAMGARAEPFH